MSSPLHHGYAPGKRKMLRGKKRKECVTIRVTDNYGGRGAHCTPLRGNAYCLCAAKNGVELVARYIGPY